MKRFLLTAAALLIALLSLFMLHTFRLQETVQIWKHYNVMYISSAYSEHDIVSLCRNAGSEGLISRDSSLFQVQNRMVPSLKPYSADGFTSESMRDFFFSDQTKSYFLLYIPEDSLEITRNALDEAHIPYGMDASVTYPILCPVLCFIAFLTIMIMNRINWRKVLCLIPLVAVSYAVPFYSVTAAILCMLFIFSISDMYIKRKGAVHILLRKVTLLTVFICGITAAALSGTKALLLFLAALAVSMILLNITHTVKEMALQNVYFNPVLIVPAKWINPEKRYNQKTLVTLSVFCLCFTILTFFSGFSVKGISSQDLLLPSPSVYTESEGFTTTAYAELSDIHSEERSPDMTDFLNEKWYADTAAYRKVSSSFRTAEAGEAVTLPSFRENGGLIEENDRIVFSFNDAYISSAAEDFSMREGIESLLVSEGGFFSTGYASTGKMEVSAFVMPAAALCAAAFLILLLAYEIKRHGK